LQTVLYPRVKVDPCVLNVLCFARALCAAPTKQLNLFQAVNNALMTALDTDETAGDSRF